MTDTKKTYHCGTLSYTKPALAILLFWLLWGDVCYTLMESVTGPIMLLKFQALDASNTEVGLILGTIPLALYSILNPVISFKSDRYRGRFGRRIPFILVSLPFLVLGLLGLAYGDRLGFWLHEHIAFLRNGISPNHMAIWTLGVLLVTFTFFNTFVTSTFWYLFNDVVPEHLLARFMSWFRFLGTLSASLYSFFIFPYSGTHSREIFIGAALLYLVGFGLMCFNVREGKYPPAPPYTGGKTGPIAAITTYAKEPHAFPHYWYLWLCTFIGGIAGGAAVVGAGPMFAIYYSQAIGLNMDQIGAINGSISFAVCLMIIGSGWLADRYHPIRVVVVAAFLSLVVLTPATMVWLFWHPAADSMWAFHVPWLQWVPIVKYQDSHFIVTHLPAVISFSKVFVVQFGISIGIGAPAMALSGMWDPPMLMRLFPRQFYGQFCSTNAVWRAVGGMCGGGLTGVFLDIMTRYVGKERAYYYLPVWSFVFGIPSFVLLYMLYKSWKRYGGDESYVPPVLVPEPGLVLSPVEPASAP